MKMKTLKSFVLLALAVLAFSSCTTVHKSMREPFVRVEFNKNDFTLSDQVSAIASSTTLFGVDWDRIFMKKTGEIEGPGTINLASIPVVGSLLYDKSVSFALYELMLENPNYDVVLYPQYEVKVERPVLGIGFLFKTTTVRVTARLGKLK